MNMYQKRKVRQEKRENKNEEKNRQIAPISWVRLMENFLKALKIQTFLL